MQFLVSCPCTDCSSSHVNKAALQIVAPRVMFEIVSGAFIAARPALPWELSQQGFRQLSGQMLETSTGAQRTLEDIRKPFNGNLSFPKNLCAHHRAHQSPEA